MERRASSPVQQGLSARLLKHSKSDGNYANGEKREKRSVAWNIALIQLPPNRLDILLVSLVGFFHLFALRFFIFLRVLPLLLIGMLQHLLLRLRRPLRLARILLRTDALGLQWQRSHNRQSQE